MSKPKLSARHHEMLLEMDEKGSVEVSNMDDRVTACTLAWHLLADWVPMPPVGDVYGVLKLSKKGKEYVEENLTDELDA